MMIIAMIVVFVVGYVLIAMEHSLRINKAGIALLIGTVLWVLYIFLAPLVVLDVNAASFNHYIYSHPELQHYSFTEQVQSYVIDHQVLESIGNIGEMIFFLLAAMTIVELIDVHGGFTYITDKITTRKKRKLLWLMGFITFFMSAILDNLTTTIVMLMLTRRIVTEPRERWLFGSIIVIAANSGGAWSPIGDVTTIMLWVKGNITTDIIPHLFIPSLISLIVPLAIVQFLLKGSIHSEQQSAIEHENAALIADMTRRERLGILIFGVSVLVLSPVFKSVTHLPPFIGLLLGVSLMWIYTEVLYNKKTRMREDRKLRVERVLGRIDISTLLFFLGILLAVDALQSAGILQQASIFLSRHLPNVYTQGYTIGLFSAIIDNVPLVAAVTGMFPVVDTAVLATLAEGSSTLPYFVVDGVYWHFLAYCAGVGGSVLIIGSAAGVVFMGIEKVSFVWYLKKISLIAFVGYTAGAAAYVLQNMILGI